MRKIKEVIFVLVKYVYIGIFNACVSLVETFHSQFSPSSNVIKPRGGKKVPWYAIKTK